MIEAPETRQKLSSRDLVTALKAAAEPTRLRILVLLKGGELNVKDLMQILRQSQPRLSRHLKLLFESGLVERFREGSWVYFRLSERARFGELAQLLTDIVDSGDPGIARDRERLEAVKDEREQAAQTYFEDHAGKWDRIRSLHVSEAEVEAAMLGALGGERVDMLVDLGTGTGRTLELFAGNYDRAIGFDVNQAMLAYARAKLSQSGLEKAQVRHGDIYNVALEANEADVVVMHQVMHYLSDPAIAISEAARVIRPGGRLLIVDFAPHQVEFLRERHAHERLGFSTEQVSDWLDGSGLKLSATRELAPAQPDGERLTVMLWLAQKPDLAAIRRQTARPVGRDTELLQET
ncbi:MAG: ArsR family transcriptional regulator [Alphaproteobacteria bacterium BRH_c36]|nr:MAG: ArsR family transcriptional regulator [Alphaproteobacteria bacterium BRH_c36]